MVETIRRLIAIAEISLEYRIVRSHSRRHCLCQEENRVGLGLSVMSVMEYGRIPSLSVGTMIMQILVVVS